MRFTWFWTFWHWSRESYRTGSLLRGPLHGIGGHWDEWFRHEASENDLQSILETGHTEASQRQFIAWVYRHWSREAHRGGNRLVPRFVLGQLADIAPFREWCAFAKYRDRYGIGGISAIVLSEGSDGRLEDVRLVEGLNLPSGMGPSVVSEGFTLKAADLDIPREATLSLLRGKGLFLLLALWILGGRRPYPNWVRKVLGLGWLSVGGLVLWLLFGPDPGEHLFTLTLALVGTWTLLIAVALGVGVQLCFGAWRQGRILGDRLVRSQTRLRMKGGLDVRGGSAGLALCLNTLLSLHRAEPQSSRRSWIWSRLFQRMRAHGAAWAATGVIQSDGVLKPVVIEPKIRACLRNGAIQQLLAPRQPGVGRQIVASLVDAIPETERFAPRVRPGSKVPRLGFAAEACPLAIHPCRHVAQAVMSLGGLNCPWQGIVGALALVVSGVMLWGATDLIAIMAPPPPPQIVTPSSPSPFYLWVSLDTDQPDAFQVVLESRYWSNRRAEVARYGGANASVRAEIMLHRLNGPDVDDGEDGTVWVERRRHFLIREYGPGERVGRYSVAYLNSLNHE